MTISISIHAENQTEYKEALRTLNEGAGLAEIDLGGIIRPEIKVVPQTAAPKPQAATWAPGGSTTNETASAPQKATVQAPVPTAEELPVPAAAPQQQAPTAPAKDINIETLRAAGRKLAMAGKMDQLKVILDKYGSENLSALPEYLYATVLAEMESAL